MNAGIMHVRSAIDVLMNLQVSMDEGGLAKPSHSNAEMAGRMKFLYGIISELVYPEMASTGSLEARILAELRGYQEGDTSELKHTDNPFGALVHVDRGSFIPYTDLNSFLQATGLDLSQFLSGYGNGLFETSEPIQPSSDPKNLRVRLNPYLNRPLPIDKGQTCSAPYMVLFYGILSKIASPPEKIFEAGLGCGYHIAYMATLHQRAKLYGTDVFEEFVETARQGIGINDHKTGANIPSRINLGKGNCLYPERLEIFNANKPFGIIYFTFMMPRDFDFTKYLDGLTKDGILIAPVSSGNNKGEGVLRLYSRDSTIDLSTVGFVPAIK